MSGSEHFSETINYDPCDGTPTGTPTTTVEVSPFLSQVHIDLYGRDDTGTAWEWHYTIMEAVRLRDALNRAIQVAQELDAKRQAVDLARTQEDQRYARELEDELREARTLILIDPWEL